MNKINFLTLLAILWSLGSYSQHTKEIPGSWIMYFGQNRISEKLSVHTEIQYRNHTLIPDQIEQLLLRTGMNFHIADNALVTAGYGYIPSYDYLSDRKPPESEEHRIWQQFISTQKICNVKLEHRYRVEQRWVNKSYKNRFRYRLMAFIPLNSSNIEPGTFFIGIYDEVFINGHKDYFDRNRLYGALGYVINQQNSVQIGYLNQKVNDFSKHYLQIAYIFNPILYIQNKTEP